MLMTEFAGNISSLFFVILCWSLSSFAILNLTTFFSCDLFKWIVYEEKYICNLDRFTIWITLIPLGG